MKRTLVWRSALAALLAILLLSMGIIPGQAAATLDYEYLGGNFVNSPVTIATFNRVDTFIVGSDHALYQKTLTLTGWQPASGLEKIGGDILGNPAAVYTGPPNQIDVFVVGSDHALWHSHYDGSTWTPFESLGGGIIGDPTVVHTEGKANHLDVFVLGSDHAIWHKYFDGTAWFPSRQSFEDLGGYSLADPIAVSRSANRLDLFAVGTDHALYHKYTNDLLTWLPSEAGYENLGGIIVGQPSVIAPYPGRLDVFIVGTDQALYHKYFSEYSSVGWQPSTHGFEYLGGHLSGTPQATESLDSQLYVVAKGTDQSVYDKYYDGSNWQPGTSTWEHLGGYLAGDVSAASTEFDYVPRVDVFVVGSDHALYHKFEINNAWYSQV